MSSRSNHQIFIDQCISLAGSINVKFDLIARMINSDLIATYGVGAVNLNDKKTWKYYLNLCGIYHPTNRYMNIKSLDTKETIIFSRANLNSQTHELTKQSYSFGSDYYNRLVNRHPDQITLINGIINPADINTVTELEDMTIVSYNKKLVESYEYSLISDLQEKLFGYWRRWSGSNFSELNDLLCPVQLTQIYSFLIKAILAIRLENSMCSQVHEFFIKTKLASNLSLDQFYPFLTRNQALFLYSNIGYILSKSGQQSNLKYIFESLTKDTGISAYSISAQHDTSQMIEDGQIVNYDTDIKFKKTQIITGIEKSISYSLNYIINLINKETTENANYISDYIDSEITEIKDSKSSKLKTKIIVLEPDVSSDVTDYENSDIALRNWIYYTRNRRYDNVISFTPSGTNQTLTLTNLNAFRLFVYLSAKINGITLATMPEFKLNNIYKKPAPLSAIYDKVDTSILSKEEIISISESFPQIPNVFSSVEQFGDITSKLSYCKNIHDGMIRSAHEWDRRAFLQTAIASHYVQVYFDEDTSFNYDTFISSLGIDWDTYTVDQLLDMVRLLFTTCTGSILSNSDEIARKISIMKQLIQRMLSYTVIIVSDNSTAIVSTEDIIPVLYKYLGETIDITTTISEDLQYPKAIDFNVSLDQDDIIYTFNTHGNLEYSKQIGIESHQYTINLDTSNYYPQVYGDMSVVIIEWVDYVILKETFSLSSSHLDLTPADIGGTGNYWRNLAHESSGGYYINSTVPCYNFKVKRSAAGAGAYIYTEPNGYNIGLNYTAIGFSLYMGRLNFNRGTRVAGNYEVIMRYTRDPNDGYGSVQYVPLCLTLALNYNKLTSTTYNTGTADQYMTYYCGMILFEFNITRSGSTTSIVPKIYCNWDASGYNSRAANCQEYSLNDKKFDSIITLPTITTGIDLQNNNVSGTNYVHDLVLNYIDGTYVVTIDGVEVLNRTSELIVPSNRKIADRGESEFGYYISHPYEQNLIQVTQKRDSSIIMLNEDFIASTNTALANTSSVNAKRPSNVWKKISSMVVGAAADPDLMKTPYGLKSPNSESIYPHICYNIKALDNYEVYCLFDWSVPNGANISASPVAEFIEIYLEFKEYGLLANMLDDYTISKGVFGGYYVRLERVNPEYGAQTMAYTRLGILARSNGLNSNQPGKSQSYWAGGQSSPDITPGLHILKITVTNGLISAKFDDSQIIAEAYIDTQQGARGGALPSNIPSTKLLYDQAIPYMDEPVPSNINDFRNYSGQGRTGFVGVKMYTMNGNNIFLKNLKLTNYFSKDF